MAAYDRPQLTFESQPIEVINYAIGRPLIVDISVQLSVSQGWYTGRKGRDGNIRKPIYDYFLRFSGSNIQSFIRFSDSFPNQGTVPSYNVPNVRHQIPAGTKGAYTVYIALQNYLDRDLGGGVYNRIEINVNFIRATVVGFV